MRNSMQYVSSLLNKQVIICISHKFHLNFIYAIPNYEKLKTGVYSPYFGIFFPVCLSTKFTHFKKILDGNVISFEEEVCVFFMKINKN